MRQLISAGILAIGIALAGMFVFMGINRHAMKDRSVTVKGLSTRDVEADHAVWPLSFSVEGNDLPTLYNELSRINQTLSTFLKNKGFSEEDLRQGNTSVVDNWASYYGVRPDHHYRLNTSLIVSTDNVQLVTRSQGCQSELLSRGIIVNSNEWELDYQFNGLSELKPSMIEEATINARAVAQKFADDARCSLGSIRHASQGQFSVESDQYQPWVKHVRVVTTIDYFLN